MKKDFVKIGAIVSHEDYSCENFIVSEINKEEGFVVTIGGKNGVWVNPIELVTPPVKLYDTALDLVGKKICIWKQNRITRKNFNAIGTVVRFGHYKKRGCYLVEFPPTINQKEPFKQWFRRNSLTQLN